MLDTVAAARHPPGMCGRFASDLPIDLIRTLFATSG